MVNKLFNKAFFLAGARLGWGVGWLAMESNQKTSPTLIRKINPSGQPRQALAFWRSTISRTSEWNFRRSWRAWRLDRSLIRWDLVHYLYRNGWFFSWESIVGRYLQHSHVSYGRIQWNLLRFFVSKKVALGGADEGYLPGSLDGLSTSKHTRFPRWVFWKTQKSILGGGFKDCLFSPLPGEMIQFD